MKDVLSACVLACLVTGARGGLTLDEGGGDGFMIGATGRTWEAGSVVGDNKGSVFLDVVFGEPLSKDVPQRTLMHLRTKGRATLAWNAYGNSTLQCELSDQDKTYRAEIPDALRNVRKGEVYRLGVTWDGDVVRVYVNGRAVDSGVQPMPIRAGSLARLCVGPYSDSWKAPRPWGDDIRIRRLRVWDEARAPADVAADEGIAFVPLSATPDSLVIPMLPKDVAAPSVDGYLTDRAWSYAGSFPQLLRGNFMGRSGSLPPHGFRLAYDDANLYLGFDTLFPGGFSCVEGIARTEAMEPEAWGSESWEFFLTVGARMFRFAGNYAGGTCESRYPDLGKKWNGGWKWAFSKKMNIDDSVHWQGEVAIPWSSLDLKGPIAGKERFNFCRSWTLPTCGTISSLNANGRGYQPSGDERQWCPVATFAPAASYRLLGRTDPAGGEYTERYSLASATGGNLVYEVSLAARDGSLGLKRIHRSDLSLKAGEVAEGSFTASTSVPGYDAVLHVLTDNGRVVMRQAVPYDLDKRVFDVTPLYLKERIRVSFRRPFDGTFRVVSPDGAVFLERKTDGRPFECAFGRDSKAGEYAFLLVKDDGSVAGEVKSFYPGIGDWERQDPHHDWVLPPFSPIKSRVSSGAICADLSLRTYGWEKSLLPAKISSCGEDLLAGRPELLLGGVPLPCDSMAVTSNSVTHLGFTAKGSCADADVENLAWIEYDGVQYNRLTVTPRQPGRSLSIRYALDPKFAKYMNASAGGQWGAKRTEKIPCGESVVGAFPMMWTGNEEKGLCFFYQSRANWSADKAKTYRFEKSGEAFTVTVSIAKGLPAGKPYSVEFGLLATPMRPLAASHPFNTFNGNSKSAQLNRPYGRPVQDVVLMSYPGKGSGDLGSFFCDLDEPAFKVDRENHLWVMDNHARGARVRAVPYTCARFLSSFYPEVRAFLPEWTFSPECALDYSHTGHFLYECCPKSSATEFFIWKYKTMLDLIPGMKGIYLDFGLIHECSNKEHGCHESMAILAQREFYRRLAVAQIEKGIADPVTVIHSTDCVQPPAMTFVTHLFNGEHIRQMSSTILHDKKDILDTYGIEMFASELSTLPWGVENSYYMPYDTLLKKNGGDEPTDAYEFRMGMASIGAGLVHDTVQSLHRNHYGLFDKVMRILDGFGAGGRAKFVGYWREPAKVLRGDGVYVSCHTAGDKVLLVIAHIAKPHVDQDVEIELDLGKLGVKAPLARAIDLLPADDPEYGWLLSRAGDKSRHVSMAVLGLGSFGSRVDSFDGKVLRYHLPFHTFGLVELRP